MDVDATRQLWIMNCGWCIDLAAAEIKPCASLLPSIMGGVGSESVDGCGIVIEIEDEALDSRR